MPEDGLKYDRMMEQALRSVVRRSLIYAAENGLPGEHHFYITFRTDDPGTQIPPSLRAQFPKEMTIVLQHQFWDLEVTEEGFSVTLSFGEVPRKLIVPFPAVVAFADPSVQFGLQFEAGKGAPAKPRSEGETEDASPQDPANAAPAEPRAEKPEGDEAPAPSENVVSFDSFRKKST